MATASLCCAAATAFFLFALVRFWREDDDVRVRPRAIQDILLAYRCPRRHTFERAGGAAVARCPVCGLEAYHRIVYRCPNHGDFEVAVRFGADDAGLVKVLEVRLPGKEWVAADEPLECSVCNRRLERQRTDPMRRRQSSGGGP